MTKTKIKRGNFYSAKNRINFLYPLAIVLMGIFLLPKLAVLSSITPENVVTLTNYERLKNNIKPLTINEELNKAASAKAKSLIEAQQFSHNLGNRRFSSWIKDTEYEYSYVGENLAIDFSTSEGAMKAWMESPSHKKNILNKKFHEIGIAIIEDEFQGHNSILIVQIFGTPKNLVLEEYPNSSNVESPINLPEKLDNLSFSKEDPTWNFLNNKKYHLSSSLGLLSGNKYENIIEIKNGNSLTSNQLNILSVNEKMYEIQSTFSSPITKNFDYYLLTLFTIILYISTLSLFLYVINIKRVRSIK